MNVAQEFRLREREVQTDGMGQTRGVGDRQAGAIRLPEAGLPRRGPD